MARKIQFITIFIAGALIIFVGLAAYSVTTAHAQTEFADQLAARLEAQGVPVISVKITSRVPFAVEIGIQSHSKKQSLDFIDNHNLDIAERETTLSYRSGPRLDSAKISFLNDQGELIFGVQAFYYPEDPSQQLPTPAAPVMSNTEMEFYVSNQLNLKDLPDIKLKQLSVTTMDTPGGQGQKLDLKVAALDVSKGNSSVSRLFTSILTLMESSRESNSSLIYAHLQILNPEGKVALDFTEDNETGSESMTWEAADLQWLLKSTFPGPVMPEDLTPSPVVPYP